MSEKKKSAVRSLLGIPVGEPEKCTVKVTRLGLEITLQELPYSKMASMRGDEDANIYYILASAVEPNFKAREWFEGHMGCPTPAEALKKLLRAGEVIAIARQCDKLNGYGPGAVVSVEREEDAIQSDAIGKALEDMEKN